MNIKAGLKALLPDFIKEKIKILLFKKMRKTYYAYDALMFLRHSSAFYKYDNAQKLIGIIIAEYHVVEKGLTMHKMRLGFGTEIMKSLINHCALYGRKYDSMNEQFIHALSVVANIN